MGGEMEKEKSEGLAGIGVVVSVVVEGGQETQLLRKGTRPFCLACVLRASPRAGGRNGQNERREF